MPQESELTPVNETPLVVDPYEAIARFYDRLMAHVDYGKWAQLTIDILADYGLWEDSGPRPKVLECACGTGSLALLMSRYGLEIDGFDKSGSMIKEAKAKADGFENAPRFFLGTFGEFDAYPPYDAVICLYDSINYLLEPEQFTEFLRRVRGVLRPGGLFLFDICTELNSVIHFNGRKERDTGPGYRFVRTMKYHHNEKVQENRFEISLDGPPPQIIFERHRQRIYSLEDVREFAAAAGLSILEETDGYSRKRPGSGSLRVHFVTRRP